MQYNNINIKTIFFFGLFIGTFMHAADPEARGQTLRGVIEVPEGASIHSLHFHPSQNILAVQEHPILYDSEYCTTITTYDLTDPSDPRHLATHTVIGFKPSARLQSSIFREDGTLVFAGFKLADTERKSVVALMDLSRMKMICSCRLKKRRSRFVQSDIVSLQFEGSNAPQLHFKNSEWIQVLCLETGMSCYHIPQEKRLLSDSKVFNHDHSLHAQVISETTIHIWERKRRHPRHKGTSSSIRCVEGRVVNKKRQRRKTLPSCLN